MSTATLEQPDAATSTDDNIDHVVCCDETVSLCGIQVPDDKPICTPGCGHPRCELCERVINLPCGSATCPDLARSRRRWWQVWR